MLRGYVFKNKSRKHLCIYSYIYINIYAGCGCVGEVYSVQVNSGLDVSIEKGCLVMYGIYCVYKYRCIYVCIAWIIYSFIFWVWIIIVCTDNSFNLYIKLDTPLDGGGGVAARSFGAV